MLERSCFSPVLINLANLLLFESYKDKYIGCGVDLKVSNHENHGTIYYNGVAIRSHPLSINSLNFQRVDIDNVVKSDIFKHRIIHQRVTKKIDRL